MCREKLLKCILTSCGDVGDLVSHAGLLCSSHAVTSTDDGDAALRRHMCMRGGLTNRPMV